jgi:uncharacterized protein YeaO (DUF488 family)
MSLSYGMCSRKKSSESETFCKGSILAAYARRQADKSQLASNTPSPVRFPISKDTLWSSIAMSIQIKRVYATPEAADGKRILVDRLWPRGLTKERARVDLWLKDVAPSTELRKWFGHDPAKWVEFNRRYRVELTKNREAFSFLKAEVAGGPVTLVYSAKDEKHNEAVVLKALL